MAPRSSESRPILCAVLDAPSLGPDARAAAGELFDAGVDWIQLRDRSLEANRLFALASALVSARDAAAARSTSVRVILNRRVDVAWAAEADGVHLGYDALDPEQAARLLPDAASVGVSLHSVEEVRAFQASTSSTPGRYAHLAPIWNPLSKRASRPPLGIEGLKQACDLGTRVLAQGGVDETTAGAAIRAGAAGVAVTGILLPRETRVERARQLRAALDGKSGTRG